MRRRSQRSTDRSVYVSAAARGKAHLDVVAVVADDRGHHASVVRVAHELGLPRAVLGGVAFLDALPLGREVLARRLAVRTARLDVHDDAHGSNPTADASSGHQTGRGTADS